jgi:hypothetical protein
MNLNKHPFPKFDDYFDAIERRSLRNFYIEIGIET